MSKDNTAAPKVFISYSHHDEDWKNRVQSPFEVLALEGLLSVWDDRKIAIGDAWLPAIEQALRDADVAILLISNEFLKSRFIRENEVPELLKRRAAEGVRVIPLVLKPCPWRKIGWLQELQGATRDNIELSALSEHEQDSELTNLAESVHDLLELPAATPSAGASSPPKPTVNIDRLPYYKGDFFGRETELKLLDDALAEPSHDTRIIQFIAAGGTGKTKLLRHWLDQHEADLPNQIVWSFYSQGVSESKQVSSSPLFTEGLKAFGLDESHYRTEEDKADAFADALIESACLLVLDGLEPLQHGGSGFDGQLKDRAVGQLLKRLLRQRQNANQNQALCIITTRIEVYEIAGRPHVISHPLDNLCTEDGVNLLRSLKIKGRDQEIEQAVSEVEGHALALHLLGNAVGTYLNGDIRKRDTLPELIGEWDEKGRHAFKMLAAYEHWLREDPDDPQSPPLPELRLLYLLSLFDHPIEISVLEALWREPIPGLTDEVNEWAWLPAIRALKERHRLLSEHEERPGLLDCHPLIREYFGRRLKEREPEGWQLAHERLYDYYRQLPDKEKPDTLDEMQPLFAAVAHGCAAGLHQRALDEVYWPRILREGEHFIVKKLGAFSDDLAVISHFFARPWDRPAPGLSEAAQAFVLNGAGSRLRALGRLREALEPMGASVDMNIKDENWEFAATNASNFSQLQLTLGEVDAALASVRDCVDYADRSGDAFQRMDSRTTQADALHQVGEPQAAAELFQAAERIQAERQPQYARLYSLGGFFFCDLLLTQGRTEEVLERAENALDISIRFLGKGLGLLDIALDRLTLARAHLQNAVAGVNASGGTPSPDLQALTTAAHWLEQAVAGLRAAGQNDSLPQGLLTRAALHRLNGDHPAAHRDLDEVWDLAESSAMRLHLTDYHLEATRLSMAEHQTDAAQQHLDTAAQLISDTGYKRRLPDLESLREHLKQL